MMKKEAAIASILIVDDQSYIQELFSQELMDEGYKVFKHRGMLNRRRYTLKTRNRIWCFLDLYLNGFEGWDLLHDIKSKYPHLPVIIVQLMTPM